MDKVEDIRLCVDCEYYCGDTKCSKSINSVINGGELINNHPEFLRSSEAYCGLSAKYFKKKIPPIEKTHHNCKHWKDGKGCDDAPCKACGPEKKNWEENK